MFMYSNWLGVGKLEWTQYEHGNVGTRTGNSRADKPHNSSTTLNSQKYINDSESGIDGA